MAPNYDEHLLSRAPQVTRADLQEGYNPDLLAEPTLDHRPTSRQARASLSPSPPPSPPALLVVPPIVDSATPLIGPSPTSDIRISEEWSIVRPSKEFRADTATGFLQYTEYERSPPFWRTRRGIWIMLIALGLVVVIALAVGLGVGLGVSMSRNNRSQATAISDVGQTTTALPSDVGQVTMSSDGLQEVSPTSSNGTAEKLVTVKRSASSTTFIATPTPTATSSSRSCTSCSTTSDGGNSERPSSSK